MMVLTVSQVNGYLKSLLDGDSNLNPVFVSGEISNFTDHYRSGHLYFSLKDEKIGVKSRNVRFQCPPPAVSSVRWYEMCMCRGQD